MKKRVFALILCILICLSMLPVSSFAEEEDETYTVCFWYTSPLTVNAGYPDFLPVGEAVTIDESSDFVIGQVPASVLQGLRSYALSQNLQDHCIAYWTVKETGEIFDFANQRVNETASEDHTLNLVATWGTENSHSYGNWYTTQEASCDAPGTKTHTCYICGTSGSEAIPAAHSIVPEPVPAYPATCTEEGTVAYYECSKCGKRFSDADGVYELTSIVEESNGHDLIYYPETAATCTEDGTVAYYECSKCGKRFSDAEGIYELTSVIEESSGHDLIYDPETEATSTEDGTVAYYECSKCGERFSNADGVYELTSIVEESSGHDLTFNQENPATCTEDGTVAYYECSKCGKWFSDAEGLYELTSVVEKSSGHDLTYNQENPATCTEDGTVAYYECSKCRKRFSDAEGIYELSSIVDLSSGHELTFHQEKPATCTEEGNRAYFYCEQCGGYFSVENVENQIEAESILLDINPEAHDWKDGVCVREGCGAVCNHRDVVDDVCRVCGERVINESSSLPDIPEKSEHTAATEGDCSEQVQWALTGTNLVVSGTGSMPDYDTSSNLPPWSEHQSIITSVVIGNGVSEIGDYAFYHCVRLTDVSLGNTIETIGIGAFQGCEKLNTISIMEETTSIGENAFSGCSALESVLYGGSRTQWEAITTASGNDVLNTDGVVECEGEEPVFEGTGGVCGADLTWALSENGTLTISGTGAMEHNSAESGGEEDALWYHDLDKIKTVIIESGVTALEDFTFTGCENLTSVSLPESLTSLPTGAFQNCKKLTSITIPQGVGSIGAEAFDGCSGLEEIEIPKSVNVIGGKAFHGCTALKKAVYTGTRSEWEALREENKIASGNDPLRDEIITCSGGNATSNPNTNTGTNSGVNSEEPDWTLEGGLLTIRGNGVIPDYPDAGSAPWHDRLAEIKTLKITGDITEIGDYAFSGCTNLKYIDLSSAGKVSSIGTHAFDNVREGIIVGNAYVCRFLESNNSFTAAEKLSTVGSSGDYVVLRLHTTVPDNQRSAIVQTACSALQVTSNQVTSVRSFELAAVDQAGNRVGSIPGGITFTLIRQFSTTGTKYGVFHLKTDGTVEKLPAEAVNGDLNVTMSSFSPVVLVEAQEVAGTGTSSDVPVIGACSDIYDGGVTASGSVTVRNPNNRKLEWIRTTSSAPPDDSAAGTELVNTNTLSNLTTSGYYYFRFKEDTAAGLPHSAWVGVELLDFYTISLTPASDEKGIFKVSGALKYNNRDNVYYALKGSRVSVTFMPADHYELYVLSVNNADKDPNTNNPFIINSLNAKADIKYAFRMSVPIITGVNHVVDNGVRVTGTIQFKTDGREIEYIIQSARPTGATEWKTLNGAKLADIKTGGTYWYRFKGQPVSKIGSVVIEDYYSVTFAKKGTGKGSYEVLSTDTAKKHENDIYLVRKGDSIRVRFKPDNGWMLYEVDKDGIYVGQANVKETMTFENITKATRIEYVFSDTAKSPKTGDRSKVDLWIAEEILSLLCMSTITWYLFRRKETY